jgi:hypothetical protein
MATLSTAAKNAALDAITALLDSGTGRTALLLYTAGFASNLVAVQLTAAEPTWGAASGGSASVNGLPNTYAISGTGTIVAYILLSGVPSSTISNATGVGDVGSGAEMEMNVRDVVAGQILRINSLTLSLP